MYSRRVRSGTDKRLPRGRLVPKLHGPDFDFLVVAPDEYWEYIHPKRRTRQIKAQYYHHPDALCVPDCVVSLAVPCFTRSHKEFNYYGDTEYGGQALETLIAELGEFAQTVRACCWKREFAALTSELFVGYCSDSIGGWQKHWPRVRDEVADVFLEIAALAKQAKQENKALLVFGI